MRLCDLLYGMDTIANNVQPDTEITGISCHSDSVQPGNLFVAISGTRCDGGCFACRAVQKGAACVVCSRLPACSVPGITVPDARVALGQLARRWYREPDREVSVIGVTGTNGKTTTTYLVRHILQEARGVKTGLIGTVQNLVGDRAYPAHRTTPDALQVQSLLRQMADDGCRYVVMEVSSHALEQHRVEDVAFAQGVFTNLTEDHLDYHGTMENYCRAKGRLFQQCRRAVCNADDPWTQHLLRGTSCEAYFFGIRKPADITAEDIKLLPDGVAFTAVAGRERIPIRVRVPGRFSVYNTLGALAVCLQEGVPLSESAAALESFQGVKGRMEVVPTPGKAYTVLIDYAHTPDALENVLQTVQGFAKKRIIAVFGCGGDRETGKRSLMGEIAGRLADMSVITSDNPRSEEPTDIIRDILPGMIRSGGAYLVEPDRREAIKLALQQAKSDDIVLLCGKGHETYQEINGATIPMDEREIVRSLL